MFISWKSYRITNYGLISLTIDLPALFVNNKREFFFFVRFKMHKISLKLHKNNNNKDTIVSLPLLYAGFTNIN